MSAAAGCRRSAGNPPVSRRSAGLPPIRQLAADPPVCRRLASLPPDPSACRQIARFVSLPPDSTDLSAFRRSAGLLPDSFPLPPVYLLAPPFYLVLFRGRCRRSVSGRLGPSGKAAGGHSAAAQLRRRGLDPEQPIEKEDKLKRNKRQNFN